MRTLGRQLLENVGKLFSESHFRSSASLVLKLIIINIGYLESSKHVTNQMYSLFRRSYREAPSFEIAYGKRV
jgi:hypothetical protein